MDDLATSEPIRRLLGELGVALAGLDSWVEESNENAQRALTEAHRHFNAIVTIAFRERDDGAVG